MVDTSNKCGLFSAREEKNLTKKVNLVTCGIQFDSNQSIYSPIVITDSVSDTPVKPVGGIGSGINLRFE